ncbi:hypothetical protein ESZ36_19470 [Colwellia demingiae]|uniref:Uncharacterized protein n=1 Tax=Colwellia demingiae TaxID=89401 RepID=A0A5C6Q841_9GAMM|nr:hypothetical protein [Colwellia demingiae]TWX64872.1 hypothetical protein ESZ36_19470 [Colwellia demingiae]
MNAYRHNAIINTFNSNPTEEQIIQLTKENKRLKDFIIKLYEGTDYTVNDMVSMDNNCYGMAIWTLTNIYPNESFYQKIKKED